MKRRVLRGVLLLRTKKQISDDYRSFLKEEGYDVVDWSDSEVLSVLVEKLYDTEVVKGKKVSSVEAWWTFISFVVKKDPVTGKGVWNRFVKELFTVIEHHRLSAIMAPRGFGKSFVSFCLYPIFKTFLFEDMDVLLCTNIPPMARRNLKNLQRIIDKNELLLEKKDTSNLRELSWGNKEMEYNGGSIETVTLGSSPRSAHVPLVIVDDPLREDNKYSEHYIRNFIIGSLLPCVNRTRGRMLIQGTPSNYRDIFHEVMNTKKELQGKIIRDGRVSALNFYSKVFDAIEDEKEKKAFLPSVYDYDFLMQIKDTQGEEFFNREYRCKCLPDKNKIFPYPMIRKCENDKVNQLTEGRDGMTYVIGVDLAGSASKTSDYSSFCVMEFDPDNQGDELADKRVVCLVCEKLTSEEQEETLISLAKSFNNAFVFIEKNNVGEFLRQRLEDSNINVGGFTTNRVTKKNAIRHLRSELANQRIEFPVLEGPMKILKEQLVSFGYKWKRGKKVMEALTGHDDAVDSLWIANKGTQDFSVCESSAYLTD